MPVVTIPFDYDPQKASESAVPIFINDTDDVGNTIPFEWIEAVVPIQDKLRNLSRRVLGDVWRVSELTDMTIHHLWHTRRAHLGSNPSFRVYRAARRKAHALEDPGARFHRGLSFSLDAPKTYRRDTFVANSSTTERLLNRDLDLLRLEGKLGELGTADVLELYRLLRAGYLWHEIGHRFDENPNTLYRRFWRLVRRIGEAA